MRKYFLAVLTLLLLGFVVFSCKVPENPEEFEISETREELEELEEQSAEIPVRSISGGEFVSKGETIPIEINWDHFETDPYRLMVELVESSGEVIAAKEYQLIENEDGDTTGEGEDIPAAGEESSDEEEETAADTDRREKESRLPELELPDIEEGSYILRYTFYSAGEENLYSKEVPFFYVENEYSISGIISYPNAIEPASITVLQAIIDIPEGSDPYLRWKVGNTVRSEGFVSEGAALLSWFSPEIEGVYSVSVELYPVNPGEEHRFASEVSMVTEVYVTAEPAPENSELQPENLYETLFHFRGNTRNAGTDSGTTKANLIGNPVPLVQGETFGYYLDGISGFSIPQFILPLDEGELRPFSFVLKGRFHQIDPGSTLFSTSSFNDSSLDDLFVFEITANTDSELQGTFRDGDFSVESVLPFPVERIIQDSRAGESSLILSVVPQRIQERTVAVVLWYFNDLLLFRDQISFPFSGFSRNGESFLGGEKGFAGLVDEFGIFSGNRDNVIIEDVFRTALEHEFGHDLRFAEGFDGVELPRELKYDGPVELQNSILILPPECSIALPRFSLLNEKVYIDVQTGAAGEQNGIYGHLSFPDTDIPDVVLRKNGVFIEGEDQNTELLSPYSENRMNFSLAHSSEGIILEIGGTNLVLSDQYGERLEVAFRLAAGAEGSGSVDTISIITASKEFVKNGGGLESSDSTEAAVASGTKTRSEELENIL